MENHELLQFALERAKSKGKVTPESVRDEIYSICSRSGDFEYAKNKAETLSPSIDRLVDTHQAVDALLKSGVVSKKDIVSIGLLGSTARGQAFDEKMTETAKWLENPFGLKKRIIGVSKLHYDSSDADIVVVVDQKVPLAKRKKIQDVLAKNSRYIHHMPDVLDSPALEERRTHSLCAYQNEKIIMHGTSGVWKGAQDNTAYNQKFSRRYFNEKVPGLIVSGKISRKEIENGHYAVKLGSRERMIIDNKRVQLPAKIAFKLLGKLSPLGRDMALKSGKTKISKGLKRP